MLVDRVHFLSVGTLFLHTRRSLLEYFNGAPHYRVTVRFSSHLSLLASAELSLKRGRPGATRCNGQLSVL